MTWVINMLSGPGSGKSTLAAELFVYMKKRGYKVEYLQEYAKELVWKRKHHILDNQHIVSYKYYRKIKSIYDCDQVDFVILDSSLLNGLYYNTLEANLSNKEKTRSLILEYYNEFNNYNVFVERGDDYEYETAGRLQTETQAIGIDQELQEILKEVTEWDTIKIQMKSDTTVRRLFGMVMLSCSSTTSDE